MTSFGQSDLALAMMLWSEGIVIGWPGTVVVRLLSK